MTEDLRVCPNCLLDKPLAQFRYGDKIAKKCADCRAHRRVIYHDFKTRQLATLETMRASYSHLFPLSVRNNVRDGIPANVVVALVDVFWQFREKGIGTN